MSQREDERNLRFKVFTETLAKGIERKLDSVVGDGKEWNILNRRSKFWKGKAANAEARAFSKLNELIDSFEPHRFKLNPKLMKNYYV